MNGVQLTKPNGATQSLKCIWHKIFITYLFALKCVIHGFSFKNEGKKIFASFLAAELAIFLLKKGHHFEMLLATFDVSIFTPGHFFGEKLSLGLGTRVRFWRQSTWLYCPFRKWTLWEDCGVIESEIIPYQDEPLAVVSEETAHGDSQEESDVDGLTPAVLESSYRGSVSVESG